MGKKKILAALLLLSCIGLFSKAALGRSSRTDSDAELAARVDAMDGVVPAEESSDESATPVGENSGVSEGSTGEVGEEDSADSERQREALAAALGSKNSESSKNPETDLTSARARLSSEYEAAVTGTTVRPEAAALQPSVAGDEDVHEQLVNQLVESNRKMRLVKKVLKEELAKSKALTSEVTSLKDQLKNHDGETKKAAELTGKLEMKRLEQAKLDAQKFETTARLLESTTAERDKLRAELATLAKQAADSQNKVLQHQTLTREVESLREKNGDYQKRLADQDKRLQALGQTKTELETTLRKVEGLTKEKNDLGRTLADLRASMDTLQRTKLQTDHEAQVEAGALKREVGRMTTILNATTEERNTLESQLTAVKAEYSKGAQDVAVMKRRVEEQSTRLTTQGKEIEELKQQVGKALNEVGSCHTKLSSAQGDVARVSGLTLQVEQCRNNLKTAAGWQSTAEDLQEKLNATSTEVLRLQSQLMIREREVSALSGSASAAQVRGAIADTVDISDIEEQPAPAARRAKPAPARATNSAARPAPSAPKRPAKAAAKTPRVEADDGMLSMPSASEPADPNSDPSLSDEEAAFRYLEQMGSKKKLGN